MKRFLFLTTLVIAALACSSWGFFGHKTINRMAVFILPQHMIRFYKANIGFITEHAVDPDKRRYTDTAEAPRHFLDADHYGESPFDSIPQRWADAEKVYTKRFLNTYGIVPWQIQRTYYALVKAFSEKDSLRILRLSADLGHYVADAHVPLHTSENYNGQLTGQTGIHAFWESRLPELFAGKYDFFVGKARYIENPLREAWSIVKHTYSLKDSTLRLEAALSASWPPAQKYSYELSGGKAIRQYSENYAQAYHVALNGMVEAQMRGAILETGSFWYSAWIDAGQPDLRNFTPKSSEASEKDEKTYLQKQIIGREL